MRRTEARKIGRAAATALLVGAALAAVALASAGGASAQVEDWRKIKYPKLKEFTIPQPERWEMKNGLVVLLMEDHELPLITVSARVRTASRLEPPEKAGLAAIAGAVLRTGGAGPRTGDEIDDFLDARGARVETGIGIDAGTATLSCLRDDFPEVVKVLADILRSPRFEEAKINVAKNQQMASIARRNDSPMPIMFREMRRLIYGADSPYARNTEYATIGAITQADLSEFHAKYFAPNRTYIGVVGDFDSAGMKKVLEDVFGDWAKGPAAKDPEAALQKGPKPGIYYIEKTDMTQSNIIMGHLGIRRDNPDYFAISVMNEVLGGSFVARLLNNIRTKKGLAYSVQGSVDSEYDHPGEFTMWMTTKTASTGAAIDALLAEVDDLTLKPVTEEEVARAKRAMLESFIFNFDTRTKILNQQLIYEYFGYPRDFLQTWRQNVEGVTPADVTRVAKTYVKKGDLAILVVGKTEGLDKPLETYGEVTKIDITIPEPKAAAAARRGVPGMGDAEAAAKGREILGRLIAAVGGEAKIDSIKSIRVAARTTVSTQRGEMTANVMTVYVLPDRMRQEMSTSMGNMTRVVTPGASFMSTPTGVLPVPDSMKADLMRGMKRLLLVTLQRRSDPGFAVMYEGTEAADGGRADMIAVTLDGETVRYAIDPATSLVLRSEHRGPGPGGIPGDLVATYSDWREVSGLMFWHRSSMTFNGEPSSSVEIVEFAVNEPVDDSQFAQPEAAAAAAQPGGGL